MVEDESDKSIARDVLRAAAGVGVLIVLIATSVQMAQGTGAAVFVATPVLALSAVPLALACWRPAWWSGLAAVLCSGVTLWFSIFGIPLVPVLALSSLSLTWRALRRR